ncbi:MAG TPA: hypothetical protein VK327_16690, partial [Candidatus Paceibacterota bacterium]|nr:hypothetical protein [Candidatus Paceibacterota bacterium]
SSMSSMLFVDSDSSRWVKPAIIIAVIGAILAGAFVFWKSVARRPASKIKAVAAVLPDTGSGVLNGSNCWIEGRALLEIAEVGRVFERHEYILSDDHDAKSLLVCGMNPGGKDWVLFSPVQPLNTTTPEEAAALKLGEVININGNVAPVRELFQETVRQVGGNRTGMDAGGIFYGIVAQSGKTILLVRWNERGVQCYEGKPVSETELALVFPKRAGK